MPCLSSQVSGAADLVQYVRLFLQYLCKEQKSVEFISVIKRVGSVLKDYYYC